MNYSALIACICFALSSIEASSGNSTQVWSHFKEKYNKVYENRDVESMRRAIFEGNLARINQHKLHLASHGGFQGPSFSIGLNHLADLSDAEYKAMNGAKLPSNYKETNILRNTPEAEQFIEKILADDSIEVPDTVDWRTVPGRVTSVKDQGQCGSCWAFATTGALEGQEWNRLRGLNATGLIGLSEQNLVDCVKYEDIYFGCSGGWMSESYRYIKMEGIDDEITYPYEATNRTCRFHKSKSVMTDTGFAILPQGDELKLQQVVAKFGPVAVLVDAGNYYFTYYQKGVFKTDNCSTKVEELDHAVLVVGYGTDPKYGDYWLVKNSWGPQWGDNGYIRMARNYKNMCGIATSATIPTFS